MDPKQLEKVTADIKNKYPDVGIQKIEVDEVTGKSTFFMVPTARVLAALPPDKGSGLTPRIAHASTLRRDTLDRSYLDLGKPSPNDEDPHELYRRSMKYYVEADIYGSHIDVLSNMSSKGFENDIDDDNIKLFFDVWNYDVGFRQILEWIFFDFFRVGMVRTYKIVGKYEPGITYLSSVPGTKKAKGVLEEMSRRADRINEKRVANLDLKMKALDGRNPDQNLVKQALAAKKKVWSKGYMPVSYTVLNPTLVNIEGSLLFNKEKIVLNASAELKALLKKEPGELTEDEKLIIKLLPSDFKTQIGLGKVTLDPMYVGAIDYRKQPYERYAKPRGVKVFDSIEYKNSLREADLSTLDGITNYILKITVGNDAFPCTDQTQLETVANLFNTTSKSFDVVWNHTLSVEKIVSPEIESVLGEDKYAQVNKDITGGLAFSRALLDGTTDVNVAEAALLTKVVIEEIDYARRQVTDWIYSEYQQIAEAMGFDRFPRVRWDNTVLKDIILYMSTISQLVDRRMLSYQTALEELGFDYSNEFNNMTNELPAVLDGTIGIKGSPFQQSKFSQPGVQPVQGAPKGTPSGGRPKGKAPKTKQPNTDVTEKTKVPNQAPSQQPKKGASLSIKEILETASENMAEDDFISFLDGFLSELKKPN